jgi:hypothetical protein
VVPFRRDFGPNTQGFDFLSVRVNGEITVSMLYDSMVLLSGKVLWVDVYRDV